MTKTSRFILALSAGLVGLALFTVTTDREFINLTPTEGVASGISLESGHTYTQIFPSSRDTRISRVGLFLRPATAQMGKGHLSLTVESEGAQVTQEIATDFIDGQSATQIRLIPPVPTSGGAEVRITLRVPEDLSGHVRAQARQLDQTFNPTYAQFRIDNNPSSVPLAYQVYYAEHPPLALQVGGLLLLTGLLLILGQPLRTRRSLVIISIALPLVYFLPELFARSSEIPAFHLVVIQAVVFLAVASFLQRRQLHPAAVILGATLFTFTTWWALHFATVWRWDWAVLGHSANLKDIFLNSNQVTAAKGGNWEHYGSYLGIIGVVLSFLGIAATLREKKYLPYLALTLLSPFLAILFPDAIILTTFGLAFFAAHGLDSLRTFLGADKLVTALTYLIVILVLLDLYNIGTRVLEYGRY